MNYERNKKVLAKPMTYKQVSNPLTAMQRLERSRFGKKGAAARNELFNPLRQQVYELAKRSPYKDMGSTGRVAFEMVPLIQKKAYELGIRFSPMQAPATIKGWLDDQGLVFPN